MSDDDKLGSKPASALELQESLSFDLRYAGRKRVHHADDAMPRGAWSWLYRRAR